MKHPSVAWVQSSTGPLINEKPLLSSINLTLHSRSVATSAGNRYCRVRVVCFDRKNKTAASHDFSFYQDCLVQMRNRMKTRHTRGVGLFLGRNNQDANATEVFFDE